eukprot:434770-Rhodomonas_salina.1
MSGTAEADAVLAFGEPITNSMLLVARGDERLGVGRGEGVGLASGASMMPVSEVQRSLQLG